MNIQGKFLWCISIVTIIGLQSGCKEEGFDVPMATPDSNPNNQPASRCPEIWSDLGGVWLDPNLCGAWSDKAEAMTWYAAEDFCGSLEGTELNGWRLPTIDELGMMSTSNHPFEDLLGDLWTSSEDSATGLMWTTSLEQPGMEVLLEPTDRAHVRCFTSLR